MELLKSYVCERFAEVLNQSKNSMWKEAFLQDLEALRKNSVQETVYTTGLPSFSPRRKNPKRALEMRKHIEFTKFLEKRRRELEDMNINARMALLNVFSVFRNRVLFESTKPLRAQTAKSFKRLTQCAYLLSSKGTNKKELFALSGGTYEREEGKLSSLCSPPSPRLSFRSIHSTTESDGNIKTLDLRSRSKPKIMEALKSSSSSSSSVTHLVLCENALSAEECLEIYNHVSKSERVVQIDLSQNQIGHVFHGEGRNPGTFTKLLSCRPRFTNLKHLNLSRNVMNVMCVERQKAFFKALERNKNLETLNLSRNDLEQSACVRLGRVLQHNRVLKCLDLSWNNFKDASALCLDRSVLEELDLSYNNISNARNFDSFTKSLRRNQTLCHLNLCGNRLDPKAIASLALCVRKNTRLLGLHVEENQGGTISSFGFVKCVETRNLSPCHIPYTTCWICATSGSWRWL